MALYWTSILVFLMLKEGAVDQSNYDGCIPPHLVASEGHVETVKSLSLRQQTGHIPLH